MSPNSKASATQSKTSADYDNPWKGMLDRFLPAFLLLFFPEVHQLIDWSYPYESVSTDLSKFTHDSDRRGSVADRAFKVTLKPGGAEVILLIHIEIQAQFDPRFPERMFIYYYRLFDRYPFPIISMALLTDANPTWKPASFHNAIGPMHLHMDFPMTKLLDFRDRIHELEASDNPFALVALAHLRHLQLRKYPRDLMAAKLEITQLLLRKNWPIDTVADVFKFLDWIILLPKNLELRFIDECSSFTHANRMPFIAPFEKILLAKGEKLGIAKGIREGKREGKRDALLLILEARQLGEPSKEFYRAILDAPAAQLQRWIRRALHASSIDEVFGHKL